MPASAAISPDSTNSTSRVRSASTPENTAASLLSPIENTPRPNGVKCSMIANAASSRTKTIITVGMPVPPIFDLTSVVHQRSNCVMAVVPSSPTAIPR